MLYYLLKQKERISKGEGLTYEMPSGDDFIWIFLDKPTEEELGKVTVDFSLNPKIFQTYHWATHSKRYSTKPYQFVFVDYFLEKNKVEHTRVLFTLEKNYMIITIPHHYHYYSELFHKICEDFTSAQNGRKTISYLLYLWLMEDTEENYDVLHRTEEIIDEIEHKLVKKEESVDVEHIIQTKRLLFQMSRRFWASAKIIFTIKKGLTPITPDIESMVLLDDIYDTFHHQLDIAAAQKDMLSDALEIYATTISNQLARINNNMSNVMKTLTALTVIIMVPTLIAGAYGMNFTYIPLAEAPYGFLLITGAMLALALTLYLAFQKKGWL